jgi:hypothetical protein
MEEVVSLAYGILRMRWWFPVDYLMRFLAALERS